MAEVALLLSKVVLDPGLRSAMVHLIGELCQVWCDVVIIRLQ